MPLASSAARPAKCGGSGELAALTNNRGEGRKALGVIMLVGFTRVGNAHLRAAQVWFCRLP